MAKKVNSVGAVPAMDQPAKEGGMSDWEHEDNARTLTKAADILSDPKKRKGAAKHIKKQKKAFRSVNDLINHKNETFGKQEPMTDDNDAGE